MVEFRTSVARKVSFRVDDPPRWQKYAIYEKKFLLGAVEYDKMVAATWKAYGVDGVDVAGLLRTSTGTPKKPYANYYKTAKKYEEIYDYDRHYNRPYILDTKAYRERNKPWREILKEIATEEDARPVQISINRSYKREPKFTDDYLEPMFKHAYAVSSFKYRNRTGIFPALDKYRAFGSYNENMPMGSHTYPTHLGIYGL